MDLIHPITVASSSVATATACIIQSTNSPSSVAKTSASSSSPSPSSASSSGASSTSTSSNLNNNNNNRNISIIQTKSIINNSINNQNNQNNNNSDNFPAQTITSPSTPPSLIMIKSSSPSPLNADNERGVMLQASAASAAAAAAASTLQRSSPITAAASYFIPSFDPNNNHQHQHQQHILGNHLALSNQQELMAGIQQPAATAAAVIASSFNNHQTHHHHPPPPPTTIIRLDSCMTDNGYYSTNESITAAAATTTPACFNCNCINHHHHHNHHHDNYCLDDDEVDDQDDYHHRKARSATMMTGISSKGSLNKLVVGVMDHHGTSVGNNNGNSGGIGGGGGNGNCNFLMKIINLNHKDKANNKINGDVININRNDYDGNNGKNNGSRNQRNILTEMATIITFFIMFLIILILMILSSICFSQLKYHQKTCLTQTCVQEAAKILESIDEKIDPCEDFYQFVCGKWLEQTIIPEHKPLENKFDELHDILNRQVRAILEEPLDIQNDQDFKRNLKTFYNSCMNIQEIDRKGSLPLMEIIDNLYGWPILDDYSPDNNNRWKSASDDANANADDNDDWSLIKIHEKLNQLGLIDDMLIPLIITSYDRNNSRNILAIKEPSFGLMNREFMIKPLNDTAIKSYYYLMLYTVELLLEQNERLKYFMESMGLNSATTTNSPPGPPTTATPPTTNTPIEEETGENYSSFEKQTMATLIPPINGTGGGPGGGAGNSGNSGGILKNFSFRTPPREFLFELDDINLSPKIMEEMRLVLEFERNLAFNSIKKEDRGNVSKLFNNMTIGQLQKLSPNIDWLDLINVFTIDGHKMTNDDEIVVIDLDYVKFLSEIIPKTSKRLLQNYIIWRVIKSKIGLLDQTWRNLKQTYNSINLGHPKIEPRWMQCVSHTHATLGTALSNIYVKNYFPMKEKAKIEKIVWEIRFELNETIARAYWMDQETRQHALDKLRLMNFRIGYPDEILDDQLISKFYENLTLTNDYFNNLIAIHKFEVENAFKSLTEINSRNDWRKYSEVVDVNAYYFHQENAFILNAGILQNHFFNPNRPNYLNYGSIGEIIGHEITHGFDSIGKQFDKTGQLKNWWNPKTNEMYENLTSCIVEQYQRYYFPEIKMYVNGRQTKDENIADNIGVQLAYKSYIRAHHDFYYFNDIDNADIANKYEYVAAAAGENSNDSNEIINSNELYLPGLKYNPKQLFWISYGLENCEKMTDEMLKLTLQIDTHSPGRYRLNGVIQNSRYFSTDFQCKLNSPMNPSAKCKVW